MPLLITIEDLKMQTLEKQTIQPYISAVRASKMNGLSSEDVEHLTITEQVTNNMLNALFLIVLKLNVVYISYITCFQIDCLISQATNAGLLSITYHGWESWL